MTPRPPDVTAMTPRFGSLYRSLFVNVALPLIVVQLLLHYGTSAVTALAVAAVFPFAEGVRGLVRSRRFDPLAVLSLIAIVAGLATSAVSGNPAFALAKDSLFTGVFGVVFLGSLAAPRPIIFQLGRQYTAGNDPAAIAAWDARWERPLFRRTIRLMTGVWGGALLLEAFLRVIAAFTLTVATASLVSHLLQIIVIVGLILWTNGYIRIVRRRVATAAA
jgi:hypothetical protein